MLNDIYLFWMSLFCILLLSLIPYLLIINFVFFVLTLSLFIAEPLYFKIEKWVKKDIFSIGYINWLWSSYDDIRVIPRIIVVMLFFVIENILLLITVIVSGYWIRMLLFKKVDK